MTVKDVGTNDIKDKQTNEIVNGILEIEEVIKKESPTTNVVISELIHRTDKAEFSQKVDTVNEILVKACQRRNLTYITHKNIQDKHLNAYGLHLNKFGTGIMAKTFLPTLILSTIEAMNLSRSTPHTRMIKPVMS